jgi:serine protease AprX
MVIDTDRKFSIAQAILVSLSFIVLIAPTVVSFSPESTTISDNNDKTWWGNWAGDMDNNRIHDALENHILEEKLGDDVQILVNVDFDHIPLPDDEARLLNLGYDVTFVSKYTESVAVKLPVGDIEKVASWDDVAMIHYSPDGEFFLSSSLPTIGVPGVWQEFGYKGENVTIAIIDTGIDDEHVALDDLDDDPATDDPKVIAFYDAHQHPGQDDGTYEPYDNNGHGTHVAGTAAGTGAPTFDNIGVAPKANLVGIKIGSGSIPYDAAERGLQWAIDNKEKFGIDIVSCSWGIFIGGPANQNGNSPMSRLMDEVVEAGMVAFVAAGNTAVSLTVYAPADSEKALTVGSVNDNHVLSIFSSQGPTADGRIKPDICAVGESVRAPRANSDTGYVTYDGTSMACPMAAGVAALVLEANPNLTPDIVKQLFHETSEHNTDARFPVSPNNGYGWGVVEAYGVVKRAQDLSKVFINSPDRVHEGDTINFTVNTTYTRTLYTDKGLDGMRIIGDDELFISFLLPAVWGVPFNINATSEGQMDYNVNPSLRFENGMFVIEAEYHYVEDVSEPTFATPIVSFQSETPGVDFDTDYPLYLNITLNGLNATRVTKNITVDNQDPPMVLIENPTDGDPVAGMVTIEGTAFDPDSGDWVEQVQIKINDDDWENVTGTADWSYSWDTMDLNNGWYSIRARAFDGEDYSEIHNISVNLDNMNYQPTAVIDSVSPNPANQGEEVSFSGYGLDDDGYISEYEWSSNIDGILGTSDIISTEGLSIGIHVISFRVKDNDGVWSQKVHSSLRINQIPIATIDSIDPSPATEGDTISFSGHGNDDRNIIAYNWRSSIIGFLSDFSSFNYILSPGVHQIFFRVQDDDGVWSQEVSQEIRINQIPLAVIDTVSPNPAEEGMVVSFAGHGNDDISVIEYEWNSSLDGNLDLTSSFSLATLSVGEHSISFRVMDNDYIWSEYVYLALEILPVPIAFIDDISPNPVNEGDGVSFSGHGEDIGIIVAYNWRSNLDGILSDLASFSTTYLSPGVHSIFFSVQNDKEVWSSEVTQDLRVNGGPTALIDSVTPNPALYGEEVFFSGHGTDDDGIINYSWSSSIDGVLSNEFEFFATQLSKGDHEISFAVQDTDFMWSEDVSVNLRIHDRPIAQIDSISDSPSNEGEEVAFSGHGTDDGSIAAYEWSSSIDGFLSNLQSFARSDLSIGTHDIQFRVMDNDWIWSEYDMESLRINQIPLAQIDYVSPDFANEGDTVSFFGRGFDDGEISSYYWYSSLDGFLSSEAGFATNGLSVGNHTIYFLVEDDLEIWSPTVSQDIRINQIPVAVIQSLNPMIPNEGDIVDFQGMGFDDGYITSYNWTSSIEGPLSTSQSFNSATLSLGEHIITLRVRDDDGVWSAGTQRMLRVNKIPTAAIAQINPNPAVFGTGISFVGIGLDDGEISEFLWSSSLDGFLSSSESFTWFGLGPGQHTISFMVKDNHDIWSNEATYQLKVHLAPVAKIVSIDPDSPNESDIIWFEGEGEDDGWIISYKWTSNIDGELSSEDVFTTILSPGAHTITLSVLDNDNQWSDTVQRKVNVNGFPKAIIDFIYPNPAVEGELVTLKGRGTDDGVITSYQWSSSRDGDLGTQSSISLDDLTPGTHSIYFKVMDDEDVWSNEVTSTLTIRVRSNIPPTVSFVTPANGEKVSNEIFIQVEAADEIDEIAQIEIRVDDNNWIEISDSSVGYYSLDSKDIGAGKHVIYARAYDGELYSDEEYIIIEVEEEGREGSLPAFDGSFFIIIGFIIVPIIAAILLYWLLVVKKRKRRDFIRL